MICCWILRAKTRFKDLINKEPQRQRVKKPLVKDLITTEELNASQHFIFAYLQNKQHYANEIADLSNGKAVKTSSNILKLNLFLQNGLLRVGGRLSKSSLPILLNTQLFFLKMN